MYKKLLTNKFFRDNPYEELSAQRLTYSTLCYDGMEDLAKDFVMNSIDTDRYNKIGKEKQIIEAENNPEALFQLLRKSIDVINRPCLVNKALKYENEILPMLVEKLIRNDHDIFIENAVRLLAKSKGDYTKPLMERYKKIRSPYVQSVVCIIFGLRCGEEIIPWMYDRYFELKKLYPNENYNQGPLLALYELKSRFYE